MMKHMLAVVMDGIKDTGMLAGYAEDAKAHDAEHSVVAWFKTRAQSRLGMIERDWHDVDDELRMHKKDDDLLDALECHVNRSLSELKMRIDKV